jgi:hypothetical protein
MSLVFECFFLIHVFNIQSIFIVCACLCTHCTRIFIQSHGFWLYGVQSAVFVNTVVAWSDIAYIHTFCCADVAEKLSTLSHL